MSGELPGINTHRVFSLFKCWVIIDLTPTLMLEKVGGGWGSRSWRGGGVGESPHPPIIFYLISSKHRFSNLSLGKIPTRIQLLIALIFKRLFSKVGFAEGVTWSTLFLHLYLKGFASGCSHTTTHWPTICQSEFLTVFVWILHWTLFLQPLGGIKGGRCFHFQTLFDNLLTELVVLHYHLRH